jgi:hypothetical protein
MRSDEQICVPKAAEAYLTTIGLGWFQGSCLNCLCPFNPVLTKPPVNQQQGWYLIGIGLSDLRAGYVPPTSHRD